MPLPTLTKTWQHDVNQELTPADTALGCYQNTLWTVKDSLVTFATLPWTVVGSSNSVAGAMDAVDRWTAPSNLVWAAAGVAHSWIVLKQTGVASNFQVLIDCDTQTAAAGLRIRVAVSYSAGFTGGSATTRPTATDEHVILSGASWLGGFTSSFLSVVHAMKSTDGESTRVVINVGNFTLAFWMFDKPANPVTGWAIPALSIALNTTAATADTATYATLNDNANTFFRHSTTNYAGFLTSEGFISSMAGEQLTIFANDIDGLYPFFPMGIASTTAGARGRHGGVNDLYWGITSSFPTGTTFPNDGSRQWAQFGHLILPWNGTNPVVA